MGIEEKWLGRQSADHLGLEPGMLWVRVPPELLNYSSRGAVRSARHPVTVEIVGSSPIERAELGAVRNWQSGEAQTFVVGGFDSHPRHCFEGIARAAPARQIFVIAHEKASAGHGRAQVAVTHPPSGIGGSTPSRRTRSTLARSSNGSGHQPLKLKTRVRFPHGS